MNKTNSLRLFTVVSSVGALTAAIVACSAPPSPDENLGEQQQGICINYPCYRPPSSSGIVSTSSGVLDPGDTYTFNCKGTVPGTSYTYEIQTDGKCWIVDPYGCKDAGGGSNFVAPRPPNPDGGCWGATPISVYLCPVTKPNMSCVPLTGACICY
jgi:hypothetical protein